MKLIPKGQNKTHAVKTTCWVVEHINGTTTHRELFTCYDVTAKDIKKLLLSAMDKK
jgi:hypothetical protein